MKSTEEWPCSKMSSTRQWLADKSNLYVDYFILTTTLLDDHDIPILQWGNWGTEQSSQ